jgi:dTDP-glucose 4,6-dehydratase
MRHIITGGSGFTGTHLARMLISRGERLVIADVVAPTFISDAVEFVRCDVRNREDLRRLSLSKDDVVYHLAARQFHLKVPHRGRDEWFSDLNTHGTRCLLEAMQASSVGRMIFFSTDMTYGVPDQTPISESHPQRPIGPYGKSKLAAEQLIGQARLEFGLRATIFRPRLISGAGRLGILSKLFRLIKWGLPVPMIGSGNNRYQMVSVEDCVTAALKAVNLDCPPGPFNLGSANPPTVRELLEGVIVRVGSRSAVVPTPASLIQPVLSALDRLAISLLYPEQFAIANLDYVLDTTTASRTLGWSAQKGDVEILHEAYLGFLDRDK